MERPGRFWWQPGRCHRGFRSVGVGNSDDYSLDHSDGAGLDFLPLAEAFASSRSLISGAGKIGTTLRDCSAASPTTCFRRHP